MTDVGALVVAGSVAGCVGAGDSRETVSGDGRDGDGSPGVTVEMTNELRFDPVERSVDVGQTVIWTNVGAVEHTVTAYEDRIPGDAEYFASGGFDGEKTARGAFPNEGGIADGESYDVTFTTAGTYEYFCIPHESTGMTATIEVT
jgi:plastocyanin